MKAQSTNQQFIWDPSFVMYVSVLLFVVMLGSMLIRSKRTRRSDQRTVQQKTRRTSISRRHSTRLTVEQQERNADYIDHFLHERSSFDSHKDFWESVFEHERPPYQTAVKLVKLINSEGQYIAPAHVGHPRVMTPEEEQEVFKRCNNIQKKFGVGALNNTSIGQEARDVARHQRPGEPLSDTQARFTNVGHSWWVQSFKKRFGLESTRSKRPLEIERAFKSQPEFTLIHLRRYIHTCALVQIQVAIKRDHEVVAGWVVNPGDLVTREDGSGREAVIGSEIVEARVLPNGDTVLWNLPLNKLLKWPEPRTVANFDEKPIVPDTVKLTNIGSAISYGRSGTWTVTLYLNADGRIFHWSIIVRGQKVDESLKAYVLSAGGHIMAAQNGYQTDETLMEDFTFMIDSKKLHFTPEKPGILLFDGHCTRLTRSFALLLAKNSIFGQIEPSHTSTLNQVCDQTANHLLDCLYQDQYNLTIALDPSRGMTMGDRIQALVQAIISLRNPTQRSNLRNSWNRVGLPQGKVDPSAIDLDKYKSGGLFRSDQLPTRQHYRKLFSPVNLTRAPLANIIADFTREDSATTAFHANRSSTNTESESYFSYQMMRATSSTLAGTFERLTKPYEWVKKHSLEAQQQMSTQTEDLAESDIDDDNEADPLESDGTEPDGNESSAASTSLFTPIIPPSGASGRISTAWGLALYDSTTLSALEAAEVERREKNALKASKLAEKQNSRRLEEPIVSRMRQLGLMLGSQDDPTKPQLLRFAKHISLAIPANSPRPALITALNSFITNSPTFNYAIPSPSIASSSTSDSSPLLTSMSSISAIPPTNNLPNPMPTRRSYTRRTSVAPLALPVHSDLPPLFDEV